MYKSFLDILNMYRKEHKGIKEVYEEVCLSAVVKSLFHFSILGPNIFSFRLPHFLRIIRIFLMNSLDFYLILHPQCQLHRLLLDGILFIVMMRGALPYPQCDSLIRFLSLHLFIHMFCHCLAEMHVPQFFSNGRGETGSSVPMEKEILALNALI